MLSRLSHASALDTRRIGGLENKGRVLRFAVCDTRRIGGLEIRS